MRSIHSLVVSAAALLPTAARACVTCDSATAHQVRHGIFNGHFLTTALRMAAPFPVFLALAAVIYMRFPLGDDAAEELTGEYAG